MRETRTAQTSIFDLYTQHEFSLHLEKISQVLDHYPEVIALLEADLIDKDRQATGRKGLSVETVLRCMVLKKVTGVSYEMLAFHLSDSSSYRAFARLVAHDAPGKSALQSNIRRITPQTLEAVFSILAQRDIEAEGGQLGVLRVDSTIVKSNIAPPSDSALLNDGVRVLCRHLAKSKESIGVKLRFDDCRKAARSLAARIFYAKGADKAALYGELLPLAVRLVKQVDRAAAIVQRRDKDVRAQAWLSTVKHYRQLMEKVVDQTRQRVIEQKRVPSSDKIVSLFESHTDVIVKGRREIDYGHKINLASDERGLITTLIIEDGNPSDAERYLGIIEAHQVMYGCLPHTVVADGGYASRDNAATGRAMGIRRVVFHKTRGITLRAMGVQQRTLEKLRNFRAGIEGNISELKRAFGAGKALWRGRDGFRADVWASVIAYNLTKMARLDTG